MVETLFFVIEIFKKHRLDYCLIGGLAMMLHNGRANTVDIDFYVLVDDLKKVLKVLQSEKVACETRGEFQLKAKVDNIPIDILFADHYIGADVVQRAIEKSLGGRFVRIATPEDLIILKSLADRTVDRRDIEELRELFGKTLDEDYIQKKLRELRKKLRE